MVYYAAGTRVASVKRGRRQATMQDKGMTFDMTMMLWPVLLIVSSLVPVLIGLHAYRRTR